MLRFDGHDLLTLGPRERRALVGKDIAMIFQDPVASLNPSYTVGFQIVETLKVHQPASRSAMRAASTRCGATPTRARPAAGF